MKTAKAFQIKVQDRSLWVTALGVTTIRDVEDYITEFRQLALPLINESWAVVLDMRQWLMSPQEVFERFKDNSQWALQRRLALVVSIFPTDTLLAWQYFKATDVPKPEGLQIHRVLTEMEARKMLQAAGFVQKTAD